MLIPRMCMCMSMRECGCPSVSLTRPRSAGESALSTRRDQHAVSASEHLTLSHLATSPLPLARRVNFSSSIVSPAPAPPPPSSHMDAVDSSLQVSALTSTPVHQRFPPTQHYPPPHFPVQPNMADIHEAESVLASLQRRVQQDAATIASLRSEVDRLMNEVHTRERELTDLARQTKFIVDAREHERAAMLEHENHIAELHFRLNQATTDAASARDRERTSLSRNEHLQRREQELEGALQVGALCVCEFAALADAMLVQASERKAEELRERLRQSETSRRALEADQAGMRAALDEQRSELNALKDHRALADQALAERELTAREATQTLAELQVHTLSLHDGPHVSSTSPTPPRTGGPRISSVSLPARRICSCGCRRSVRRVARPIYRCRPRF
jgi:hypothetical protein